MLSPEELLKEVPQGVPAEVTFWEWWTAKTSNSTLLEALQLYRHLAYDDASLNCAEAERVCLVIEAEIQKRGLLREERVFRSSCTLSTLYKEKGYPVRVISEHSQRKLPSLSSSSSEKDREVNLNEMEEL